MKVKILNKVEFDNMMTYMGVDDSNVEQRDLMLISICSPAQDNQPYISGLSKSSYFRSEHKNVKILYFGDYGESQIENNEYLFTNEQAKELYEFIKRNKNKSTAILHCGAGISRSGAVGTFIHDLYGTISYEEFRKNNPRIFPNSYVLWLLRYIQKQDK